MATLNVNLADEVKRRAEAQAAEAGFGSVDAYLANLIESDRAFPIDPALEADLVAGLESGAREISDVDWARKKRLLVEKFQADTR
jgi:hypothetical protein